MAVPFQRRTALVDRPLAAIQMSFEADAQIPL
jgi:hypothetical protein